eukprot:TRINITY_DN19761_c0_g1_i1.p1 TRINITY_DN19761_c0_g1~~TRINITY_DN19761_c0_g1_i1.p1  ORF type:complete len:400 (-),score=72.31 TRINITY_DN19761_c0_g1_i1:103-1302(-)
MPTMPAMSTVRTLVGGLGEACQPFVRGFGAQACAPMMPGLQTQQASPSWKAGLALSSTSVLPHEYRCSALRNYPESLSAILEAAWKDSPYAAAKSEGAFNQASTSSSSSSSSEVVTSHPSPFLEESSAVAKSIPAIPVEEPPTARRSSRTGKDAKIRGSNASAGSSKPVKLQKETPQATAPLAVASQMLRDYEQRLRQLERQCRELNVENLQLRSEIQAGRAQYEQSRELNARLGKEVLAARKRQSEAVERTVQWHDAEVQTMDELQVEVPLLPLGFHDIEPPPGLSWPEKDVATDLTAGRDLVCSCNSPYSSFGCEVHRVYNDRLMLAHRGKCQEIALGAPGLERDPDSSLEPAMLQMATVPIAQVCSSYSNRNGSASKKHRSARRANAKVMQKSVAV